MKIAVVGGGLSGLTAAFSLQQRGHDVTVFESLRSAGGAIATIKEDGFLAEAGPHTIMDSNPSVGELIDALGLRDQVVYANESAHKRFVVKDGQVVALPSSPPALLKSPLYSRAAKLALLKEPFVSVRNDDVDESVTSFINRRLHPDLLTYGLELLVNGVWAGDPNKLSARHAFRRMFGLVERHGSLVRGAVSAARSGKPRPKMFAFRDGNQTLVDALAEQIDVEYGTRVKTIAWEKDGVSIDDRWFDHVIVTAQQNVLSKIDFRGGVPLANEIVSEVVYPPVAIVTMGFKRADVKHPLDGFGMIVPFQEERKILGALFPSTLFPNRAPDGHVVIATFVGGARQGTIAKSKERRAAVLDDLRSLLTITGDPVFESTAFWSKAIPQYDVGYGRVKQALDAFEKSNSRLSLIGGMKDGIAVPDLMDAGWRMSVKSDNV